MATMNIGSLVVDLIAESAQYIAGLQQANQATQQWSQRVTRSFSSATKSIAGMAAGYLGASIAIDQFNQSMTKAKDIENLSRLAGQSADEFQATAYAVEKYGVSMEQLGDISKDTSDKLGDFIATGGGEFKDFFEQIAPQVGLTAEELQYLSGPEVLQAVKDAMDQANIPMKQQIFYLESIANDASKLIPVLENQGRVMHDNIKEYEDMNTAMSETDIQALRDMEEALKQVQEQANALTITLQVQLADAFTTIAEVSARLLKEFNKDIEYAPVRNLELEILGLNNQIRASEDLIQNYRTTIEAGKKDGASVSEVMGAGFAQSGLDEETEQLRQLNAQLDKLEKQLDVLKGQTSGGLVITVTEGGEGTDQLNQQRLNRLQQSLKTQEELLIESYQKQNADIEQGYNRQKQLVDDLVISEEQALAAGYESKLALQNDFHAKAKNQRDESQAELLQQTQEDLDELNEKNQTYWDKWADQVRESTEDFDTMWGNAFNNFASSFGDAVADAIMSGEDFSDTMDQIAVGFSRAMISALVEIATKRLALWVMENTFLKSQKEGDVLRKTAEAQSTAIQAGLNTYASTAAIPVTGPALAPAAAATALAFTEPMVAAVAAAASASLAGMAHAGVTSLPDDGTWLLKKRERVIAPEQNADLTRFLQEQNNQQPQVNNQFTFVIESGAGQQADQKLASDVYNEFAARLVQDAKTNGPVRRAMNGG